MTNLEKNLERTRKYYLVDSSVILDDVNNLKTLSNNNENYIFLTDTVLEEINRKKGSKNHDVAFQARYFGRICDNDEGGRVTFESLPHKIKASIKNNEYNANDSYYLLTLIFNENEKPTFVFVIHRPKYKNPIFGVKDDVHIAEIANDYSIELITNDILFKIQSRIEGIKANSFQGQSVRNVNELEHLHNLNENELTPDVIKKATNWEQFVIDEGTEENGEFVATGRKKFGLKLGDDISYFDFENNDYMDEVYKRIIVRPINLEQKFYFQTLVHPQNNITVCAGSTGSGKTLIALQAGLHMLYNKEIDGIVYTRNTVTATDKEAELGFRKGDEDQKLGYFMLPLYNAINFTMSKHKKDMGAIEGVSSTQKTEETVNFMKDNNIEIIDIAHLRGATLDNKFIIIDECQNMNNSALKLIGTRIGKRAKVLFLGDVKQVDHSYLSTTRNALATLLKKATEHNEISGIKLKKTVRSEVAEFFDKNL